MQVEDWLACSLVVDQTWGACWNRVTPTDRVDKELDVGVACPSEVHFQEDALLALPVHAHCLNANRSISKLQLPEAQLLHEWRLHALKNGPTYLLHDRS